MADQDGGGERGVRPKSWVTGGSWWSASVAVAYIHNET